MKLFSVFRNSFGHFRCPKMVLFGIYYYPAFPLLFFFHLGNITLTTLTMASRVGGATVRAIARKKPIIPSKAALTLVRKDVFFCSKDLF